MTRMKTLNIYLLIVTYFQLERKERDLQTAYTEQIADYQDHFGDMPKITRYQII